jgi:hypothetical protein
MEVQLVDTLVLEYSIATLETLWMNGVMAIRVPMTRPMPSEGLHGRLADQRLWDGGIIWRSGIYHQSWQKSVSEPPSIAFSYPPS